MRLNGNAVLRLEENYSVSYSVIDTIFAMQVNVKTKF